MKNLDFTPYQYDSVEYTARNTDLISKYIKIVNNTIGVYIKGQDNPYIILDKDKQTITFNQDINRANLGTKAEATRIKICALLNTAYDLFVEKSGWQYKSESLGTIDIDESALDNRKIKFNINDLITPAAAE